MTKSRLEAFTDAVIAIVMTILVLGLQVPKMDSFASLWELRHQLFIYVVSFASLAVYWNNHHHLFQVSQKINGKVLWINMLFLFFLTLFPFATAWVGDHLFSRIPELVYGTIVLLADSTYAWLVRALIQANGSASSIAHILGKYRKMKVTLVFNILALIIGFFIPIAVLIIIIGILIIWLIPEKKIEKALS